jgi:hypothetical protein
LTAAPGSASRVGRARARVVRFLAAGLTIWLAAGLQGCAGSRPRLFESRPLNWGHPRVAFLPLENLTNRSDAAEILTRVFYAELARTGICEPVEPGEVESLLSELGTRNTGSVSVEQLTAIGKRLRVEYVLLGTVLESGTVRTSDSDVPSVGVALRLLHVESARVAWAAVDFRTGDDRETLFGWGREYDAQRLGSELAARMLSDLARVAGATAPTNVKEAGK